MSVSVFGDRFKQQHFVMRLQQLEHLSAAGSLEVTELHTSVNSSADVETISV